MRISVPNLFFFLLLGDIETSRPRLDPPHTDICPPLKGHFFCVCFINLAINLFFFFFTLTVDCIFSHLYCYVQYVGSFYNTCDKNAYVEFWSPLLLNCWSNVDLIITCFYSFSNRNFSRCLVTLMCRSGSWGSRDMGKTMYNLSA